MDNNLQNNTELNQQAQILPETQKKKKPSQVIYQIWRAIWPVLVAYALNIIMSLVLQVVVIVKYITGLNMEPSELTQFLMSEDYFIQANEIVLDAVIKYGMILTIIWQIVVIALGYPLFRSDEKKRLKLMGGVKEKPEQSVLQWAVIVILGISSCMTLNLWISAFGLHNLFPSFTEMAEQVLYSGGILIQLLGMGIGAPLAEELLFRGLIFKRLRGSMSYMWAAILTAVCFGLYHGNMVQFIYAFILSLMLTYVYEKFKTIWAPILLHAAANVWSVILTHLFPDELGWLALIVSTVFMGISLVVMIRYFRERDSRVVE
jgi:membrane protease YdiL (CAAX protease family)